jgi:hypothetical protein
MNQALLPITVVRSTTHIEIEWMRIAAVEVKFDSPMAQAAYCENDLAFANAIEDVVLSSTEAMHRDHAVYTNSDWWPNRNRAVTVSTQVFSLTLVQALAGLLTAQYADWRINVTVVDQLPDPAAEVGSMFITPECIVIEQSLHSLLQNSI